MSSDRRASSFGTPLLLEIFSAEGLKNVQYFGAQVSWHESCLVAVQANSTR
jgi:hypothetical protein